MSAIQQNIEEIYAIIQQKKMLTGQEPGNVTLVAVTKTISVEKIKEAIGCGIGDIGENKVQEVRQKYPFIGDTVRWHLIGHLQANKVKEAVRIFDLIHSVDTLSLAVEINKQAQKINKIQDILLEVNISGETSKFGCKQEEAIALAGMAGQLAHLRLKGLMTMAPFETTEQMSRSIFRGLKELAGRIRDRKLLNVEMRYLSMGMTSDYEIALEEGANIIRIGTGIFGERVRP